MIEPSDIQLPKINARTLKEFFRGLPGKIRLKLKEYRRVLVVTKKPGIDEFKAVVKVTAIGTLLIGAVGFAVHMVAALIKGAM